MAKSKDSQSIDETVPFQSTEVEAPVASAPVTIAAPAKPTCPQSLAGCTGERVYRGVHNGGHWYECEACGNGSLGDDPAGGRPMTDKPMRPGNEMF